MNDKSFQGNFHQLESIILKNWHDRCKIHQRLIPELVKTKTLILENTFFTNIE
jgi:hypothetical protein